ncbi:MAG: hypothetical protein ACQEXX_15270 [Bacillota bacterium]
MKKFWIGTMTAFVLVAASWIGNLWYFQAHQLGEPIFLEHHVEVLKESGDTFDLYYLEDVHGKKKIRTIFIPNYPEMRIEAHTVEYSKYTHQQMGRFIVSVQSGNSDKKEGNKATDPQFIETVLVHYSDGSSAKKNIGEIRLIDNRFDDPKKLPPIEGTSSGGSSESGGVGTGFNSFRISRLAELQEIESAYLSLMETSQFELYFDYQLSENKGGLSSPEAESASIPMLGTPLKELQLPIQLNKNDYIRLSYRYRPSPVERGKVYRLSLRLRLKERNGVQWNKFVPISFNSPYLTEAEVRSLLSERRKRP